MATPHRATPDSATLDQRIDQQLATYWRARVQAALDRLEREARRMFQLEGELSQFANDYYAAVGEASERLAQIDQVNLRESPVEELTQVLPSLRDTMDMQTARTRELKSRYRTLAKEIHPDRTPQASAVDAERMGQLNQAYQNRDIAAMLTLEAQLIVARLMKRGFTHTQDIEHALRDIDRAANTYAESYRAMLNSPLNELMLRAMSARLAGWDWIGAVVRKVERAIEAKERALVEANIAAISEWRAEVQFA